MVLYNYSSNYSEENLEKCIAEGKKFFANYPDENSYIKTTADYLFTMNYSDIDDAYIINYSNNYCTSVICAGE